MLQERSCPIFKAHGDAVQGCTCGRSRGGVGTPPGPSGGVVSTTVSPEGGVGGRKSGI